MVELKKREATKERLIQIAKANGWKESNGYIKGFIGKDFYRWKFRDDSFTCEKQLPITEKDKFNIVDKEYELVINLEEDALKDYYNTLIKKYGGKEHIAAILAKEKLDEKLEFLAKREDARVAFKAILDKISQGHQDLFNGKNDLSSEELIKKMIKYGKELTKSIKVISDAF